MNKDELLKLVTVLQAELEATNRQVEILSDALAESRREAAPKDEALDLALEALETCEVAWPGTRFKSKYFSEDEIKAAITAIKQARALDKKAENARELGLDYEPSAKVRDFWEGYVPEPQYSVNCVNHDCDKCKAAAQPAPVQEHITDGSPCWCEPETSYTDPETGASVIVHREPQ